MNHAAAGETGFYPKPLMQRQPSFGRDLISPIPPPSAPVRDSTCRHRRGATGRAGAGEGIAEEPRRVSFKPAGASQGRQRDACYFQVITMKCSYKERCQRSRDCTSPSSTKLPELKGKHPKALTALTRRVTWLLTKELVREIVCSPAGVETRLFLRLRELNRRLEMKVLVRS